MTRERNRRARRWIAVGDPAGISRSSSSRLRAVSASGLGSSPAIFTIRTETVLGPRKRDQPTPGRKCMRRARVGSPSIRRTEVSEGSISSLSPSLAISNRQCRWLEVSRERPTHFRGCRWRFSSHRNPTRYRNSRSARQHGSRLPRPTVATRSVPAYSPRRSLCRALFRKLLKGRALQSVARKAGMLMFS